MYGSSARVYGDEPSMIASNISDQSCVVVGKKRASNLKRYFYDYEPDVILLDDGHQHLKIQRNLNIILFDSSMNLNQLYTAPKGYLREGLSALSAADFIVFSRADQVSAEHLEQLKTKLKPYMRDYAKLCEVMYKPSKISDLFNNYEIELSSLVDQNVVIISGIASPDSFTRIIHDYGANIIENFHYADHYNYTEKDILKFIKIANDRDAIIIMTEKDMVKVKKFSQDSRLMYLRVKVSFMSGEKLLLDSIKASLIVK